MASCGGGPAAREAAPLGVRVGAGYGASFTDLSFGDLEVAAVRHAVLASTEVRLGESRTLSFAAGAALGGHLDAGGERHAIEPGWVASVSYAARLVEPDGAVPFVLSTVTFAASSARTAQEGGDERARLIAFDLRGGLIAGWTLGGAVSPYAAARVFGGPILWEHRRESIGGTDRYHYQLAAGAVLRLEPVDLHVEGAFLGERFLGGGAGVSF